MNQGEFYTPKEYNTTTEYMHFPAESYIKVKEENRNGNEDADLGKETTSFQERPARKQGGNDAGKSLIDKIFKSVRGVATTATVVAASVVVTTSIVASTPTTELITYECGETYIEYEMKVSGLQENSEYAIVLSAEDEEEIKKEIEEDGTYKERIEGLKPECEYTLALVQYDAILGNTRHFEQKLQTLKHNEPEPEPPPIPNVTVTGAEIVGINEIKVYFTQENLTGQSDVVLNALYKDQTTATFPLTEKDISRGFAICNMENADVLTLTPTVTTVINGETIATECASFTQTFEETFKVDVMVGLYEQAITFYPIGIQNGAEYIRVTSSLDPGNPEMLWFEDVVKMWYSTNDVITYTLYLSNDNGDALSNEVTVTVDTSVALPTPDYNMNCPNPGDICVTYNDDGSINMYIQTNFTSSYEQVYYQITAGGIRYTSREPIARIENIPDTSYALHYDVCVEIDGAVYSIFNTTPSGMANEEYFYHDSSLENKTLSLKFYKDSLNIDLNSVKVVTPAGEEIEFTEADFVYNGENGMYELSLELSEDADTVHVYLMANPYSLGLENIDDYIGNERRLFDLTVSKP